MIDLAAATRDGILTISGVTMMRPAFAVLDVTQLWEGPDQRGDDTEIPGRPGALSNPRRAAETTIDLRMLIDGTYRVDGTPAPDPVAQVRLTLKYLRQNVSDPTYIGDGTRTLVLATADGATLTGPVTVGKIRVGTRGQMFARAVMPVTIPAGALVETP
jgi:hypothetical protein